MKFYAICVSCMALVLSSCSVFKKNSEGVMSPSDRLVEAGSSLANTEDALSVINGSWLITEAAGAPVAQTDEENPIQITFDLNKKGVGTIYCFAGCNFINGDVVFIPSRGIVEPKGNYLSTMKACDPTSEAVERNISGGLAAMRKFRLEQAGNGAWVLTFTDSSGNPVLKASRWDTDFLNGAWEVTRVGDLSVDRDDDMQLVIDLPMNRLHGNTGCNIINGSIRITSDRPDGLEIANMASTRRLCPPDIENKERALLVALEDVASARPSSDGEEAYLLDSAGKTVVTLHRLLLKR